jgi:long-subunit fatty acid transport protein
MGRAGASIAGGDTLHALWYNPANLVEFTGVHTLLDVGTIFTNARYQRDSQTGPDGKTMTFAPVENEAFPIPDPSLMIAIGWKEPRLTVAYGVYAPYATNLKFPDTGSQRYALVDLTGSLFVINHLAAAWSPHPRFRVGAGFQAYTAMVRLLTAASAYLGTFGAPEDNDLDLYTEASVMAPFAPSGNVGVWARLVDTPAFQLDLAASVQLPVFMQTSGKIKARLPTHPLFDPPTRIEGEAIETSLWFPMIVRGAVRVSFGPPQAPRANIEAAFVYEGWSVFERVTLTPAERIVVKDVPTIGDYVVPPVTIERSFTDAFSVRLGGSVNVLSWLSVRAGVAYEQGAIPDRTFSVFLLDSDKIMVGVGLSFRLKNHTFDLSYGGYFFQQRDITNSEVKQINLLNSEGAVVIGNGIYDTNVHVIGLAWRGAW